MVACRSFVASAVGLVALLALGACSSGSSGDAKTQPTPSPKTSAVTMSPTPSPTPTPPGARLAALAAKGVTASFTATYRLATKAGAGAKVQVYRRGDRFRVGIARGDARSVFLTAPRGLVSCRLQPGHRLCLLVARPGDNPPPLFNPSIQRLFTADLRAFAARHGVRVTNRGSVASARGLPAASCFHVSGKRVDGGVYCLAASGVLRSVQLPSGRLVLLTVHGTPKTRLFIAPLKPTPLPGLK
ncbi:MAG: hypothetical protein QOE01_394 [Actinomycetota bacterium]|nr:hypothetical protein [Actinomycetota bacterium]